MTFFGTIFVIILIFIIALFGRIRNEKDRGKTGKNIQDNNKTVENKEIEEIFFKEVSNGKEKIRFLKIDNQFDLMFIKSIFQSENIPYYIEFENISRMRPGMYVGDLGNYNLVHILEKDYDNAIKIVKEYIKNKKNNIENTENIKKEYVRNIFEILFGGWKVPSASDTHGIEIIFKKKKES